MCQLESGTANAQLPTIFYGVSFFGDASARSLTVVEGCCKGGWNFCRTLTNTGLRRSLCRHIPFATQNRSRLLKITPTFFNMNQRFIMIPIGIESK